MNVPPSARPRMVIVAKNPGRLRNWCPTREKLAGAGGVSLQPDGAGAKKSGRAGLRGCEVFIPLAELVDVDKEREPFKGSSKANKRDKPGAREARQPRFRRKGPRPWWKPEREKAENSGGCWIRCANGSKPLRDESLWAQKRPSDIYTGSGEPRPDQERFKAPPSALGDPHRAFARCMWRGPTARARPASCLHTGSAREKDGPLHVAVPGTLQRADADRRRAHRRR